MFFLFFFDFTNVVERESEIAILIRHVLIILIVRSSNILFNVQLCWGCRFFCKLWQKLIKIFSNLGINGNLRTQLFLSAFKMTLLSTLNTSKEAQLRLRVIGAASPNFKASHFFVPIQSTSIALDNISFDTINGEMADFVAFEADFFSARKRVMRVFSTKNTCCSLGLVRTATCPMTALSAIFASKKWIFSQKVAIGVLHQFIELKIALSIWIGSDFFFTNLLIHACFGRFIPLKVLITLEEFAARD